MLLLIRIVLFRFAMFYLVECLLSLRFAVLCLASLCFALLRFALLCYKEMLHVMLKAMLQAKPRTIQQQVLRIPKAIYYLSTGILKTKIMQVGTMP